MQRERKFMTDEIFDIILHEYVVPYKHVNEFCPPTLIPHKDGEILLNKNALALLKRASDIAPDMKIDIYSHGLLLPAWAKRGKDFIQFLATLPNNVRYMMSYHPYNHDDSVNDYSQVVPYLQEVLRNPPPNIEFITVSHKSKWVSQEMQDAWRKTGEGLPITVHSNCSINPWTGRMEDIATCTYNGCPYADFGHWFFGVTGNVIACCLDLEEEIVLGNVLIDNPADMFAKTEAFYAMQRKTYEEKRKVEHQVCANCHGQRRNDLIQLGIPA